MVNYVTSACASASDITVAKVLGLATASSVSSILGAILAERGQASLVILPSMYAALYNGSLAEVKLQAATAGAGWSKSAGPFLTASQVRLRREGQGGPRLRLLVVFHIPYSYRDQICGIHHQRVFGKLITSTVRRLKCGVHRTIINLKGRIWGETVNFTSVLQNS